MDVGQNGRPRGPQMWMSSLVLTIHNFGVPNFDPYPYVLFPICPPGFDTTKILSWAHRKSHRNLVDPQAQIWRWTTPLETTSCFSRTSSERASASSPHYPHHSGFTGWWFGTMEFYDFPYIGNHNPNWRTHIFQRGWNYQPAIIVASTLTIFEIRVVFNQNFWSCNELQFAIRTSCLKIGEQNTTLSCFISFPGKMILKSTDFICFPLFSNMFTFQICIFSKSSLTRTVRLYDPDPLFEDRRRCRGGPKRFLPKQPKL